MHAKEPHKPREVHGVASDGPGPSTATVEAIAREVALSPDDVRAALGLPLAAGALDGCIPTAGRYLLGRRIGEGGDSEVFEAVDPVLARRVAIKIGRRASTARLRAEAAALACVRHRHVLDVYELGETADGRPFLAVELATGGSLAACLGAPLSPATAVRWLREAALGLEAARAQGFLHRDIKPSNLLLDEHGRIKLADFGLSVRGAPAAAGPRDGRELVGTAAYVAPEQARGGALDVRADLYALGATFYHLLAGRPPWPEGEAPAVTIARRLLGDPPPLASVAPHVPEPLARTIDALLARDRDARPADPVALVRRLDEPPEGACAARTAAARAPWWRRLLADDPPAFVAFEAPASLTETHRLLGRALGLERFRCDSSLGCTSAWTFTDFQLQAQVLLALEPDAGGGVRGEAVISASNRKALGILPALPSFLLFFAIELGFGLASGRPWMPLVFLPALLVGFFDLRRIRRKARRQAEERLRKAVEKVSGQMVDSAP